MAIAQVCTMAIVHACTMAIAHACTMAVVHAYDHMSGIAGGPGGAAPRNRRGVWGAAGPPILG